MKISDCGNMKHLTDIDKDTTFLPIDIVVGNDDKTANDMVRNLAKYGSQYFNGMKMMQVCVTKVANYWDGEVFGRKVTNFVFVFFTLESILNNTDGTLTLKGNLERKRHGLFDYSEPYPLYNFIYTNLLLGKFKIDYALGVPVIEIVDVFYDVAKEEGFPSVYTACL